MKRHIVTVKKYDQEGKVIVNQFRYRHKSIAVAVIKAAILLENPFSITYKRIGKNGGNRTRYGATVSS